MIKNNFMEVENAGITLGRSNNLNEKWKVSI